MSQKKDRRRILSVSVKDCEMQTFAAGGKGGQRQNTCNTGIRLIHHPSGARGEARDNRSQAQNKKSAFLRLVHSQKFDVWLKRTTGQIAVMESEMERMQIPDSDLVVEVKCNGKWMSIDPTKLM